MALAHPGHSIRAEAQLAYLFAVTGRSDSAQAVLDDLTSRFRSQIGETGIRAYVSAIDLAVGYAGLGQVDSAFAWIEAANQERATEAFQVAMDARFKLLHSDPRWAGAMDRYFGHNY
jgi:hypothetical protein